MVIRKGLCEWIAFGLRKRAAFLAQARQHKNEKPFINPLWQHFSTAPKLTEVSKFYLRNPTVSLQYNSPFSKLRSLASAVQLPFRTDSNPHRRYPETLRFRCRWLHDDGRSLSRKPCIERRFESSPESRGSQTSGVLFGSFCTTQKERKNVSFAGSSEVLPTSKKRTVAAASHRNN